MRSTILTAVAVGLSIAGQASAQQYKPVILQPIKPALMPQAVRLPAPSLPTTWTRKAQVALSLPSPPPVTASATLDLTHWSVDKATLGLNRAIVEAGSGTPVAYWGNDPNGPSGDRDYWTVDYIASSKPMLIDCSLEAEYLKQSALRYTIAHINGGSVVTDFTGSLPIADGHAMVVIPAGNPGGRTRIGFGGPKLNQELLGLFSCKLVQVG